MSGSLSIGDRVSYVGVERGYGYPDFEKEGNIVEFVFSQGAPTLYKVAFDDGTTFVDKCDSWSDPVKPISVAMKVVAATAIVGAGYWLFQSLKSH